MARRRCSQGKATAAALQARISHVSRHWDLGGAGRLPEFLGIGAQKAGTTTLHALLAEHPQVFLPPGKELQFFSLHAALGPSWYARQFEDAGPGQLCGEITPYYLFHPEVPGRIQALLPAVRLIVLLRDPVERALSQYFHACRLGFERLPLMDALRAEPERLAGADLVLGEPGGRHGHHQELSYLARSRYEVQLERYEARFAPDQLLVLRSEDLFGAPEPTWWRVLQFLGLEDRALLQATHLPRANAGGGESRLVSAEVRAWMAEQLAPTYAAMAQRYGLAWKRFGSADCP